MHGMRGRPLLLLLAMPGALLCPRCLGKDTAPACPPPSDQVADILVSGRTSTPRRVDVVSVGTVIPQTFSGKSVGNTEGFAWYVSRHYALKTDYDEPKARFYLQLLEMAYPHYVALFGKEPEGIDRMRMAVIYAKSKERLDKALLSDGIKWDFKGGGITYEGRKAAYEYPSGSLQYHQRYIVMHECTHLYQMCLTGTTYNVPGWYREGIAEMIGHHVYDTQRRRLTVNVLDKPTTHDYLDEGLAQFAKEPLTVREIDRRGGVERGVSFLLVQFLNSTPDRMQRFRLWQDQVCRAQTKDKDPANQTARAKLLEDLYGPWDKLEADFKAWRLGLHNTFHYAEWGWEQEGEALCAYGFAEKGRLSQTDVLLIPNRKPAPDPFRMDYPKDPPPPIVGPVARGAEEPSLGAVIDFRDHPNRGIAGIGMGVIDEPAPAAKDEPAPGPQTRAASASKPQPGPTRTGPRCLKLLISQSRQLTVDGEDLGMKGKTVDLSEAIRKAMAADGNRVGLTVSIGKDALQVTLRAKDPNAKAMAEQAFPVPIDGDQRRRLMSRPLTILARDGWHRVTPYFDDGRTAEVDLSVPANPDRWRNPGDRQLASLYRAWWCLGSHPPASLSQLRLTMLEAADKDPPAQQAALETFGKSIAAVIRDVEKSGAKSDVVAAVVAELRALARR